MLVVVGKRYHQTILEVPNYDGKGIRIGCLVFVDHVLQRWLNVCLGRDVDCSHDGSKFPQEIEEIALHCSMFQVLDEATTSEHHKEFTKIQTIPLFPQWCHPAHAVDWETFCWKAESGQATLWNTIHSIGSRPFIKAILPLFLNLIFLGPSTMEVSPPIPGTMLTRSADDKRSRSL